MNLFVFLIASLGALALLHFAWIPAVERRLSLDRSMAVIGQYGLLSLLGALRSILLITTLTTAVIILIVFVLQLLGGATVEQVANTIETIKAWRTALTGFGSAWGATVVIVLILALSIYANRRGKVHAQRAFQRVFDDKYQRLERRYDKGTLKSLPPTSEMEQVEKRIAERYQILAQLQENAPADESVKALSKEIYTMKQYLKALDIQRRIDPKLNPEDVELPQPKTFGEKVQTFFISRGLLASLNKTSRALFVASMILLVPSLIGVHSGTVKENLNTKTQQLTDYQIQLRNQEFLAKKQELGEPEHELSEEDEQALDEVARAFENAVAEVHVPVLRGTSRALRSNVVRGKILERAAQRRSAHIEKLPSGSQVESLTDLEKAVVRVAEDAVDTKGPTTKFGRGIADELKDIARRDVTFLENVKAGLRSFQRPAASADINRALINHITGLVMDPAPGELSHLVNETVGRALEPGQIRLTRARQSNNFLVQMIDGGGENLGKALNRVSTIGELAELQPAMRTVLNRIPVKEAGTKLAKFPPGLKALPESHINLDKAITHIDNLRTTITPSKTIANPELFTSMLSSYADEFPAQVGAEKRTVKWKLTKQWTERGILPSDWKPVQSSEALSTRARNFRLLKGYSKVGGIVIGKEPSDEASFDFVDFRWEETDPSTLQLVLISADGQEIRSHPHRKSILYYALNYAADARPLTVTIINTELLGVQRILLHPTLLDTPLGVRMIELDHFVFEYTDVDARAKRLFSEARSNLARQKALYDYAWAKRIVALENVLDRDALTESMEWNRATTLIEDEETRHLAAEALEELALLSDPSYSLLTHKDEFFDETLVELMRTSAQQNMDLDAFGDTITKRTRSALERIEGSGEKAFFTIIERWFNHPPEFSTVSGVQEKDFRALPEHFMLLDETDPRPFDFVLQITFETPPYFLKGRKNPTSYADLNTWDYPHLRNNVQEKVLGWAEGQARKKTIMDDISEFIIAQRFFRMALNGHLGDRFPVERLLAFSQSAETVLPQASTRTLRWNVDLDVLEGFEASLENAPEMNGIEMLQQIRQIREALGISKDIDQASEQASLPSLERR